MKKLEVILTIGLGVGIFGSCLGFESNLRPLDDKKFENTSFDSYVSKAKESYGMMAYPLAVVTYPGAKLAAEIHNSRIN